MQKAKIRQIFQNICYTFINNADSPKNLDFATMIMPDQGDKSCWAKGIKQ
jgi:hypothetical protein